MPRWASEGVVKSTAVDRTPISIDHMIRNDALFRRCPEGVLVCIVDIQRPTTNKPASDTLTQSELRHALSR